MWTRPLIPHLQKEPRLKCSLARSPSRLTAQMIDETFSRALRLFTHSKEDGVPWKGVGGPRPEKERERKCPKCAMTGDKKRKCHTTLGFSHSHSLQ